MPTEQQTKQQDESNKVKIKINSKKQTTKQLLLFWRHKLIQVSTLMARHA